MSELYHKLCRDLFYYQTLHKSVRKPGLVSFVWALMRYRGFFVIAVQRITAYSLNVEILLLKPIIYRKLCRIISRCGVYLVNVLAKSEILSLTVIEPGVYISNQGHMVLGARGIGSGTVIHHCITLGKNDIGDRGHPLIGKNVWIGPHSVIFGNITIGDGVTILPGTVVTKSIPPGVVVQGNPARLVQRQYDNSDLRSEKYYDESYLQQKLNNGI